MQKRLIMLVLFSLVGLNVLLFAQDGKKKAEFESFKKRRIAFITKEMQLTNEEAKVFWPLCNELQEKKFNLNQQVRKILQEFTKTEKEGKKHSEQEYLNMVKLLADFRVQEAKLDQEYLNKFAEVIPAQKVYLYQEAEKQFIKEVFVQQAVAVK